MLDQRLSDRDIELKNISAQLKEKFIGIDDVIDQFIDSVRIWYLMPELMIRPVVVNLWGLTGSGKTDMVRTFVRMIKMSSSFVEMQMDIGSNYSRIQDCIEYADIQPDQPSILLLDEIQRFRTIDEKGVEITKKSLQDVWMLLSDGRFQSASDKKADIQRLIFEDLLFSNNIEIIDNENQDNATNSPEKEKIKKFKYKNSYWQAQRLKKLLNFQGTVEEVMQWDCKKKIQFGQEALNNNSTFEGSAYSKMLIIIAGNIDEAYKMSDDVSNADTDANIFHEFSKKINIITIKNALSKRFKPEQVSRFGNNHIIYPSLSKDNYKEIIRRVVAQTIQRVYDLHKIKIIPDESVFSTIYQNGVFPAQGVRPVFSTISGILDSYIPVFVFKAIEKDLNVISVGYSNNKIFGVIGDETISCKVELSISKIKEEKNINDIVLSSIHEAGHALVYSVLYKIPPTQIKSRTSSSITEGFVGIHGVLSNKKTVKDEITTCLAGQAAEEIFFGSEFQSCGSWGDITRATSLASSFVRHYGFDGKSSRIGYSGHSNSDSTNTNIESTNDTVENLVSEGKQLAISIIGEHKFLFRDIAQRLINYGEIKPEELCDLFTKHNIDIKYAPINAKFVNNYEEKWNNFFSKQPEDSKP
jgi:cell division protease FtsH